MAVAAELEVSQISLQAAETGANLDIFFGDGIVSGPLQSVHFNAVVSARATD